MLVPKKCTNTSCTNEAGNRFKGMCKQCYYTNYERSDQRRAYKRSYNAQPHRQEYSRIKSKTAEAKLSRNRFQKTEKFQLIQTKYRMTTRSKFNAGRRQALTVRGVTWELTYDQYLIILSEFKDKCHYCGGELTKYGCNLDRKDNSVGYIISNVVTCCGDCNRTKGDRLSYVEMVAVSELLRKMRSNVNL